MIPTGNSTTTQKKLTTRAYVVNINDTAGCITKVVAGVTGGTSVTAISPAEISAPPYSFNITSGGSSGLTGTVRFTILSGTVSIMSYTITVNTSNTADACP